MDQSTLVSGASGTVSLSTVVIFQYFADSIGMHPVPPDVAAAFSTIIAFVLHYMIRIRITVAEEKTSGPPI